MKDKNDVRNLGKEYLQWVKNQGSLMEDSEQMKTFLEVYDYFKRLTKEQGGDISPILLNPKELHGYISVHFNVLDLNGEHIKEFCNILMKTNSISIDPLDDGETICIGMNVNDIFIPKENA